MNRTSENGAAAVDIEEEKSLSLWARVKPFLIKWHLPIMMIFALVIGYLAPLPGQTLYNLDLGGIKFYLNGSDSPTAVFRTLSHLFVAFIFLMSGSKLKTSEVKAAFREWPAALFGVISILLLSPLLTFWIATWNLSIPEFTLGLCLFFSQATTLSSGTIIAAQARGNIAIALLLTVLTNILAVLTMPLFVVRAISTISASDVEVAVSPVPIILQLVFLIILPLGLGKLLRNSDNVVKFVAANKLPMKLTASFLLAAIVWMNISDASDSLKTVDGKSLGITIVAGIGLHLVLLIFNFSFTTWALKLKQPEKRSVVILASQKTLPVSITVLELLDPELVGATGLIVIPIVASHFVQIVIDAFLAAAWGARPLEDEIVEASISGKRKESDSEKAEEEEDPEQTTTMTLS